MKKQKQKEEDQLYKKIDLKIPNKLYIERVQEKSMIWSLQQSDKGKLIISVFDDSIKIRSSGSFKLLMKRYFIKGIVDSCFSQNLKYFVVAIHDGNLFVYQSFVNLVYHQKFDIQQKVKFITNEELLIWNQKYLMKFNIIKQQIAYRMTLNKKFPIYYLDFNIGKELIFIGTKNIKIRSLNNGLLLLESEQLKDDEIKYIKYLEINQIITRHKTNKIIIWSLNIDQSIIEQSSVIHPLENLAIIYTCSFMKDFIFTIQCREMIQFKKQQSYLIIYTKTGSILNIRRLERNPEIIMIRLVGQHINLQLNESKCIFFQTDGDCIFYFQIPSTNLSLRYDDIIVSKLSLIYFFLSKGLTFQIFFNFLK